MKAYTITVLKDGDPVQIDLRLTLKGQLALRKRFSESALATIFSGMDDTTKLLAVFSEALNFKNNENVITDAEELYDAIVDSDLGGISGFREILVGIARASGLLSEKEAAAVNAAAEDVTADMLSAFGGDDEDDEKNPELPRLSMT